jgi:hypothetical protein
LSFYDNEIDPRKEDIERDEGKQLEALIRYHFKIDPSKLSDNDFFDLSAQLVWVIEQENKKYKSED